MNKPQKTLYVKEARHKRLHSVWFHLYEISRQKADSGCLSLSRDGLQTGGRELSGVLEVFELSRCLHDRTNLQKLIGLRTYRR